MNSEKLCKIEKEREKYMKKKQVVSGLLSAAMVMNVALVDMGPVQAATQVNLALNKNVTASSYEKPSANRKKHFRRRQLTEILKHGGEQTQQGKKRTY